MIAPSPVLSKRAQRAIEVLRNGGRFVETIEDNGLFARSRWVVRLYLGDACVRGIGAETFRELRDRLIMDAPEGKPFAATVWRLNVAVGVAP